MCKFILIYLSKATGAVIELDLCILLSVLLLVGKVDLAAVAGVVAAAAAVLTVIGIDDRTEDILPLMPLYFMSTLSSSPPLLTDEMMEPSMAESLLFSR